VFASAHIFKEQSTRQIEWINSFSIPAHKYYLAVRAEQTILHHKEGIAANAKTESPHFAARLEARLSHLP